MSIARDSDTQLDFDDVRAPGILHIEVSDNESGRPLDARINIEKGDEALIGYFGRNTFFTELDRKGKATVSIPPGDYVFKVAAGGGFTSLPQLVDMTIETGQSHALKADIAEAARPRERGWYNADLHHHSDVLDGFTEPEYVMRSLLAAGVDITFLSDHDSIINNGQLRVLSEARDMQFIAGTEMSPSWAHFNVYPLDDGKDIDIDTGMATVQEIFSAARGMGADVIEVNHPYSEYGFFQSLETDSVPGGFDAGFDLVEIEALSTSRNSRTLERVWSMWNEGQKAYLAGGSDVHDVWLEESGAARTYAYVDGELSVEKFVLALKAGHAFATQGPLVYPEILFGSEVQHVAGEELVLNYAVEAVSGLRQVQLVERGEVIETRELGGSGPFSIEFSVSPDQDSWYSLVVEDNNENFAYTNPVWVLVRER